LSVYEGIVDYYQVFGIGGLLRACSNRMLGMPKEISVSPRGVKHPVHIWLRTSDVSLFNDLLLRQAYNVALPFAPRTIIDAGANVGMATLFYANKYPLARIAAIEPEPSNYAMLLKNVAAYPNVVPVNAALWNSDDGLHLGPIGVVPTGEEKWAFMVTETGIPVRGITMQTLMRETAIESIDLLKMDIESGEIEAFANCADWMRGVKGIVIELHDHIRPGCKAVIDAACEGFRVTTDGGEMTYYIRQ
jgi:FkbM family methyltransferase